MDDDNYSDQDQFEEQKQESPELGGNQIDDSP